MSFIFSTTYMGPRHTDCNPSIQKEEARGWEVQGHPWLGYKLEAGLDQTVKKERGREKWGRLIGQTVKPRYLEEHIFGVFRSTAN